MEASNNSHKYDDLYYKILKNPDMIRVQCDSDSTADLADDLGTRATKTTFPILLRYFKRMPSLQTLIQFLRAAISSEPTITTLKEYTDLCVLLSKSEWYAKTDIHKPLRNKKANGTDVIVVNKILKTDNNSEIPTDPFELCELCMSMGKMVSEENFSALYTYSKKMPKGFTAMFLTMAVAAFPGITEYYVYKKHIQST